MGKFSLKKRDLRVGKSLTRLSRCIMIRIFELNRVAILSHVELVALIDINLWLTQYYIGTSAYKN